MINKVRFVALDGDGDSLELGRVLGTPLCNCRGGFLCREGDQP
jgi:hypothetical protein